MYLVDTSMWIEVFRAQTSLDLQSVVAIEEIVTCLPVVQEVLQGFRDEGAFQLARKALLAMPIVESPLQIEVVEQAARPFRAARRAGLTVRSGVDCLIAACALRHDLVVLHRDRDFPNLARVAPLRVESV